MGFSLAPQSIDSPSENTSTVVCGETIRLEPPRRTSMNINDKVVRDPQIRAESPCFAARASLCALWRPAKKQKPRDDSGLSDTETLLAKHFYVRPDRNIVKPVSFCRVTRGGQGSRTLMAAKATRPLGKQRPVPHWQYPPKRFACRGNFKMWAQRDRLCYARLFLKPVPIRNCSKEKGTALAVP